MNIAVYISLLISILGFAIWFISKNAKLEEAGRLAYFAGLLAFCLLVGHEVLHAGTM